MLPKHLTALVVGLVASTLVLAACGPSAAPPAPSEQTQAAPQLAKPGEIAPAAGGGKEASEAAPKQEQARQGGTINIRTSGRWNSDPAMGQTPYTTWYYIGEPMIRRNAKTFELEPASFESWKISEDGKEILLKVRQGMKFHDKPPINGRDVEAKDLVYSIKSLTGLQYPDQPSVRFPRKGAFTALEDIEAVDKNTVKVTLKSPSVSFIHGLTDYRSTWVYPDGLREHFGGLDSLTVADPKKHIGAGPYTLTKYSPDVEMIVERNPEYWDQPRPYADKFRVVFIRDNSTNEAAFVAGKLHLLSTSTDATRNYVVENYAEAQVITYEPNSCWDRISLNTQRKPFDDNRVRKALFLVIDKAKIGKVTRGEYQGQALWVWPGPIPFTFPEARPQEELAKHPMYLGPTPENVAEAQRLLKEAGYEKGFEFTLHFNSTRLDAMQLIEQDWATHLPQVKVTLKVVDSETHRTLAAQGEYDAQGYCHIFDVTAVAHITNAYHTNGGRNYGRNNDPELDAILDDAERALDPAKYKDLMRKAEDRILDSSLAMLPYSQYYAQLAVHPDMKGVRPGPGTSYYMDIRDWWLTK